MSMTVAKEGPERAIHSLSSSSLDYPPDLGDPFFDQSFSTEDQQNETQSQNANQGSGYSISYSSISYQSERKPQMDNHFRESLRLKSQSSWVPLQVPSSLTSWQFRQICIKYKDNLKKLLQKQADCRNKKKKKLFSIYPVQFENKKQYLMHTYKRDLTPIQEHFPMQNEGTPYLSNFSPFAHFDKQAFKQDYLSACQDVEVSAKCKDFTTYSVVQPKPMVTLEQAFQTKEYKPQVGARKKQSEDNFENYSDAYQHPKKKNNFHMNIQKLIESKQKSPDVIRTKQYKLQNLGIQDDPLVPLPSHMLLPHTKSKNVYSQHAFEGGDRSLREGATSTLERHNLPLIRERRATEEETKMDVRQKTQSHFNIQPKKQVSRLNKASSNLFKYNPADEIQQIQLQQLKDNFCKAVFNYKEPLNRQLKLKEKVDPSSSFQLPSISLTPAQLSQMSKQMLNSKKKNSKRTHSLAQQMVMQQQQQPKLNDSLERIQKVNPSDKLNKHMSKKFFSCQQNSSKLDESAISNYGIAARRSPNQGSFKKQRLKAINETK